MLARSPSSITPLPYIPIHIDSKARADAAHCLRKSNGYFSKNSMAKVLDYQFVTRHWTET